MYNVNDETMLTGICEVLLLLIKLGGVIVGEVPPVTREILLAALSLYPSFMVSDDDESAVETTEGGRAFSRRRLSSSRLALHSSGVFPWALGQPETAKCIAYIPVRWPSPSHPGVGQWFPLLASTSVYGIRFLFFSGFLSLDCDVIDATISSRSRLLVFNVGWSLDLNWAATLCDTSCLLSSLTSTSTCGSNSISSCEASLTSVQLLFLLEGLGSLLLPERDLTRNWWPIPCSVIMVTWCSSSSDWLVSPVVSSPLSSPSLELSVELVPFFLLSFSFARLDLDPTMTLRRFLRFFGAGKCPSSPPVMPVWGLLFAC